MKRERIKKYKSKKMSAMILAALLMGTVVQAEPVNNGDTKVHYFSVKSDEKAAGSNFDSDGAKADGSMVIGIGSTSNGINSTVVGNNNTLKGGKRDSDGVHRNNSIVVGESIEVEGTHNAVFGTDYMNWDRKLTKVAGEQNTVIGVGNLVGYTAEKDLSDPSNPKWTYTKLYDRGSDANVAVGMTNTVNGGSVVLGTSSEIKDGATLATSVGHANTIQGSEYGVALGNNLLVEGYGAIAVGTDSKATADYATAIGTEAVAEQEDSIAFGDAAKAQSKYSIAFGSFAKAKAGSGVAIGSSSLADREKGSIGYLAGENTSEVWKATRGAVSVGNKEKKYTRQITGVAAGTEDTDAVNVAQLKALNTKMDQGAIHYFSVKSDEKAAGSNFDNDGAKADGSMVIGIGSTSEGINSTVIGKNNKLTGNKEIEDIKSKKVFSLNNSIVAGQNLEVDGYANTVFATESIYDMYQRLTKVAGDHNTVIGAGNLVGYTEGETVQTYTKLGKGISSNKNVVIGTRHTVSGSDNVVLGYLTEFEVGAAGVTAIGSANHIGSETQEGVAIGNNLGINGQSTVAMGFGSGANAKNAIVLGSFSFANAKNAIVLGSDSSADAENSLAIGSESFADAEDGVALGAYSMANREAGMAGYLANGKTTPAWKSTLGALSVGAKFDKVEGTRQITVEDTRQITGVAAGTEDTDAVNVAQLKAATEKITGSITDTTLEANNNALSLDGSKLNLSVKDTAGNEVKGSVDLNAIKSVVDTNTYTTGGTYDAATKKLKFTQNDPSKNYEIDVSAMLNDVVDTDTRNTIVDSDTVTVDSSDKNADGSINYKLNVKTDGKVAKGDKGIVTGGTVYNETRIEKDGHYIKAGNTAGENLIALDQQVGVNSTNITKLENNIYDMRFKVGELDNRMNKVGAGAAALAALHPLDFDPDDKWDIAAGIGNYKNATAAAVGFFYRPNERTMLNLGWTMGDNRNMVNGGFSIKLGSGANISTSKTAMAREIRTLRDVVSQQNEQIERQNRKIEKQEREMKEVLEILAEMRKDKK